MREKSIQALDYLNNFVIKHINSTQIKGRVRHQPLADLFTSASAGKQYKKQECVVELAMKGSKKHRKAVVQIIYNYIVGEVKPREKDVDDILSGYYINYYGTATDVSSSADIDIFTNQINKILIPKNSPLNVKYEKLAQVCFQELYGLGPLDEFLNFKPDEKFVKIEEIAMAGPTQLSLKISGVNVKLDKITYDAGRCKKITKRLAKCSTEGLTKNHTVVETELADSSRVTLTCPDFGPYYTFNVRLHYGQEITRAKKVELGSSTWDFETFLDLIMMFRARILVAGPQGVGKSTDIRDLCTRFPRNTVVVTGETAFELALDRVKHLTVIPTRLGILSPEDYLRTMFRFNADCLVLGEARDANDVFLFTQMAQRQEFGTISTWHAATCHDAIMAMSKAFLRGRFATNESDALYEVTHSIDLVITKSVCDEKYGKYCGRRHVAQVCEVKKSKPGDKDVELNVLFEYDYQDMTLRHVNEISDEFKDFLLSRAYLPDKMKVLAEGSYRTEKRKL